MLSFIVLGTIMALFGVFGHQRGTRASVFATGIILLGLLGISRLGANLAAAINIVALAVRLVIDGGAQAADGNASAYLDTLERRQLLSGATSSGLGAFLLFAGVVAAAMLVTNGRWFSGKPSGAGLLAGLANGYLVTGFLFNRVLTGAVSLPLPFGLGEGSLASSDIVGGGSLGSELSRLINLPTGEGSPSLAIAVGIVLFVVIATRFANKKG